MSKEVEAISATLAGLFSENRIEDITGGMKGVKIDKTVTRSLAASVLAVASQNKDDRLSYFSSENDSSSQNQVTGSTFSKEEVSKPSDTIVHIQTIDDQIIPAPLALLTKYCSFIADLPHLDYNYQNGSDTVGLSLPSATSDGMRLFVKLLEAFDTGCDIPSPWRGSQLSILYLQHVIDALTIADAYDIPFLSNILNDSATYHLSETPLLAWVISVLVGDMDAQHDLQEQTLSASLNILPIEIRTFLDSHSPEAVYALYQYHEEWSRMVKELRDQMFIFADKPWYHSTGSHPTLQSCRVESSESESAVRVVAHAPSSIEIRRQAAQSVLLQVAHSGAVLNEVNTRDAIGKVVACEICKTLLFQTFLPAIRDFGVRRARYGMEYYQEPDTFVVSRSRRFRYSLRYSGRRYNSDSSNQSESFDERYCYSNSSDKSDRSLGRWGDSDSDRDF